MYTLSRAVRPRELMTRAAPSFAASLLIAELFYKFGSFSLECVAFLATWFAVDAAIHFSLRALTPNRQ